MQGQKNDSNNNPVLIKGQIRRIYPKWPDKGNMQTKLKKGTLMK